MTNCLKCMPNLVLSAQIQVLWSLLLVTTCKIKSQTLSLLLQVVRSLYLSTICSNHHMVVQCLHLKDWNLIQLSKLKEDKMVKTIGFLEMHYYTTITQSMTKQTKESVLLKAFKTLPHNWCHPLNVQPSCVLLYSFYLLSENTWNPLLHNKKWMKLNLKKTLSLIKLTLKMLLYIVEFWSIKTYT